MHWKLPSAASSTCTKPFLQKHWSRRVLANVAVSEYRGQSMQAEPTFAFTFGLYVSFSHGVVWPAEHLG